MNINRRNIRVPALLGLLILVASAALPAVTTASATHSDLVGQWQGTLDAGDFQLRVVFDLNESEEGELEATMDSPDQGANGIPIAAVEVEGNAIRLEIRVLGATYEGQLIDKRQTIEGEWSQAGRTLPLKLERAETTP